MSDIEKEIVSDIDKDIEGQDSQDDLLSSGPVSIQI